MDDDVRALAFFMEAIVKAHAMDRHIVRDWAAEEFDTDGIVGAVIAALHSASQKVI